MNTQKLNEHAPELFKVIRDAQNTLAEWIVPDSKITDADCLNNLLGILDNRKFVEKMWEVDESMKNHSGMEEKVWDAPNVQKTVYDHRNFLLDFHIPNGSCYRYVDVPLVMWTALKSTEHIGKFWAEEIKGKFRYVKIE